MEEEHKYDKEELEHLVDEMLRRTDEEAFRIMHLIAQEAINKTMEG